MRPLVRAALAAASVVALAHLAEQSLPARDGAPSVTSGIAALPSVRAPCPAGSLPDRGACIPVPAASEVPRDTGAAKRARAPLIAGEHIPRRPDRPPDYARYRWPVPIGSDARAVTPSEELAVALATEAGSPVRLMRLEHEEGDATVVFVGELKGKSVITRHSVREGAELREVLVVFGRLGRLAPELASGPRRAAGTTLGFAGSPGPSGHAELYLAVRRVRDAVATADTPAEELLDDAFSVAVDPRNALALAP